MPELKVDYTATFHLHDGYCSDAPQGITPQILSRKEIIYIEEVTELSEQDWVTEIVVGYTFTQDNSNKKIFFTKEDVDDKNENL